MDYNQCFLQGQIGEDFKFSKTESGTTFATFSLAMDGKFKGADCMIYIRIMVFKPPLVKYLQDVGAKRGNRCTVIGSLQSYKREIKGESIIQNTVLVNDITIRKTATKTTEQQQN